MIIDFQEQDVKKGPDSLNRRRAERLYTSLGIYYTRSEVYCLDSSLSPPSRKERVVY